MSAGKERQIILTDIRSFVTFSANLETKTGKKDSLNNSPTLKVP